MLAVLFFPCRTKGREETRDVLAVILFFPWGTKRREETGDVLAVLFFRVG